MRIPVIVSFLAFPQLALPFKLESFMFTQTQQLKEKLENIFMEVDCDVVLYYSKSEDANKKCTVQIYYLDT
jgi:hypothetical protein